jgi:hypothetical protein
MQYQVFVQDLPDGYDPTFDDWVEEIAKQRQEIEAQESLP